MNQFRRFLKQWVTWQNVAVVAAFVIVAVVVIFIMVSVLNSLKPVGGEADYQVIGEVPSPDSDADGYWLEQMRNNGPIFYFERQEDRSVLVFMTNSETGVINPWYFYKIEATNGPVP